MNEQVITHNAAWGQPLENSENHLSIGSITQLDSAWPHTPPSVPGTIMIAASFKDYSSVYTAIDKLKVIAETIEKDIAYFNLVLGQSMAINKFSFIKRDVLEVEELLKKDFPKFYTA